MSDAPRDQNFIPTALGESSTTPGLTLPFQIDEITGRLLVSGVSGGGNPGSPDTSVQFNDGGSFGGDSGLRYEKAMNRVFLGEENGFGFISTPNATTGDNDGGDFFFATGDGFGNGNGGDLNFETGSGSGIGLPGNIIFNTNNTFSLAAGVGNTNFAFLDTSLISSSDKTFKFPNKTGTFALLPVSETPTGSIDGVNKVFTTATTILAVYGLYMNGQYIHPVDYSTAGTTITFVTAPDISYAGLPFTIVHM